MKKLIPIFTFLFAICFALHAQVAPTLTGNWIGILHQDSTQGVVRSQYQFSMTLTEIDGTITGTSTITSGNDFGTMTLKGKIKNASFTFKESQIKNEEKTSGYFNWCLKKGTLLLRKEESKLILEGNWQGYTTWGDTRMTCSPGTIFLTKESEPGK